MEVSEDIRRELVYGLNALLLERLPGVPRGAEVASRLVSIVREEGPRFHEPTLLEDWQRKSGLDEDLEDALAEALHLVLEELADQEDPFSARQLLELLAQEPFWTIKWGFSGGQDHVPIRAPQERSVPLPLSFRAPIVAMIDQLEAALYALYTDQRSVHDRLEDHVIADLVAATVRNIGELGRARKVPDLPGLVASNAPTSLAQALFAIQEWKLTVDFDADPDDDDGEWTMRVLERLYRIDWFLEPTVVGPL